MYTYRIIEIYTENLTRFECNKRYNTGDIVDWKASEGTWIVLRKLS